MELTCHTIAGNVAATLQWPDDAPVNKLAEAIMAEVRSSGFTGLKEPFSLFNLRLLKPDGGRVLLGASSPSLPGQLGLEPSPAAPQSSSSTAPPVP